MSYQRRGPAKRGHRGVKVWRRPGSRHDGGDVGRQEGDEAGEVLDSVPGHRDRVLDANVEPLLGDPEHRIDREHLPGNERSAPVLADVVDRHPDRMREVIREVEALSGRLLVARLREHRRVDDLTHRLGRACEDIHVRDARADASEQFDVVAHDEAVELELPRLPLSGNRPHTPDVARVVTVVGCGVHEHELSRLEPRGLRPVVAVPDVVAGSDDRLVGAPEGTTAKEDELRQRTELVLHHARSGRPHRLEDREPGQPSRLAQQRDLGRALDRPQLIEERARVSDVERRELRSEGLDEGRLARPGHGPGIDERLRGGLEVAVPRPPAPLGGCERGEDDGAEAPLDPPPEDGGKLLERPYCLDPGQLAHRFGILGREPCAATPLAASLRWGRYIVECASRVSISR